MWITLDQILSLKMIDDTGSITSASEKLNKAKSAVHYSIKKLEEQLNFPLIESQGYRSQLTQQAKEFLYASRTLLHNYEELKEKVHQIATGVESRFAVSASALYPLSRFNQHIQKLQTKYPKTEIVFHREILSGKKFLNQGIVDISLFEHDHKDSSLEMVEVDQVFMHLVISKKHPLAKVKTSAQTFEALLQHPQVVQRATIPSDENYGVHNLSRQWTVTDLAAKKQIILDGLGWGRLPEHEIATDLKSGRLICLGKIEKPEKVSIFIGRKKNQQYGKVNQAFWEMLTTESQ